MGTRADFYVGRGEEAEWLGSIAWDGNPNGIEGNVLKAQAEEIYREAVSTFLGSRDDATLPEHGWPWPWDDSNTTDYAYALDHGTVYASSFGYPWFVATEQEPDMEESAKGQTFPNMKERKNVTFGSRSGIMVINDGGVVPPKEIDKHEDKS